MAKIGDQFKPGDPAPEPGTFQCTGTGCSQVFKATVKGTPLPSAHHPGATWKLVQVRAAGQTATPKQAPPATAGRQNPPPPAASTTAGSASIQPPPKP